jgi:hypothetical protein
MRRGAAAINDLKTGDKEDAEKGGKDAEGTFTPTGEVRYADRTGKVVAGTCSRAGTTSSLSKPMSRAAV